jgi:transcriptional regulator with XRE-family HTH domain
MDAAESETVGQRVRRLRTERGWTQRELSAPGCSYGYISRIERGDRKPTLKALRVLAKQLGVSTDYLEFGAPVPLAAEAELRVSDAELQLRLNRDLERAEAAFRAEVDRDGEPVLVARAHAGLGLLAERRADHAEAIRHLEAATRSGYLPPETSPDLYRDLARAYVSADAPARAVELLEGCLADLRERVPDDAGLRVRFSVYLATAYSELGSSDRARRVLTEASEEADDEAATAPPVRVSLYWGLATEAWDAADSDGALAYIRRAIGLLESSEDTYSLALAHLLASQMMNLDGRFDEAGRHLERAERLFLLGADQSDLGILRAEQAIRAAALGAADEAMARATEAARLLGDDARHLPLKWRALGSAHRLTGDIDQAARYFAKALALLKERRRWREASTVAREWARMLRAAGREDAFALMEEASLLSVRSLREETARARGAR